MARLRTLAAGLLLLGALASAGPAPAQDADTPLDQALQEVEALLTGLRADPGSDPDLVAKLEKIAGNLRRARASGAGSAFAGATSGGPGGGLPGGELPGGEAVFKLTLTTFLEGTELKEDHRSTAEEVLREFVVDYNLARNSSDDKSKAVIRDHTEKRIGRNFPPRDGNRLRDNLDTIIKRWEWGFGRRGR